MKKIVINSLIILILIVGFSYIASADELEYLREKNTLLEKKCILLEQTLDMKDKEINSLKSKISEMEILIDKYEKFRNIANELIKLKDTQIEQERESTKIIVLQRDYYKDAWYEARKEIEKLSKKYWWEDTRLWSLVGLGLGIWLGGR